MAILSQPGSNALPNVGLSPEALSRSRVAVIIGITVLAAVALYYFIGIDEGMTSLTGKSMLIHEWVHDSRHFLGFPCH